MGLAKIIESVFGFRVCRLYVPIGCIVVPFRGSYFRTLQGNRNNEYYGAYG